MRIRPIADAAWKFETEKFFVGFYAEPEDVEPEDLFEFQDDIDAVRDGTVEWFQASVRVFIKNGDNDWRWLEIGADHLGCCAYNSVREFYESHRDPDFMDRNCSAMRRVRGSNVGICHYFPDMVSEAISAARKTLAAMPLTRHVA